MDIAGFLEKFNNLPLRHDYTSITDYFENDLIDAGFDFANNSEEFLEEYLIPHMIDINEKLQEIDDKAMDVLRAAGVDEMKIKWRNFKNVKLGFFDLLKIRKLQKISKTLLDINIENNYILNAIYKNRPDLQEKYGSACEIVEKKMI